MIQPEVRLVMGIPTVRRKRDYVQATIRCLLERGGARMGDRARIVLMNVEDPPEAHDAMDVIRSEHAEAIRTGALTLVTFPHQSLSGSPGSAAPRTEAAWTRRQTLHAAALMELCAPIGSHYLHIEDAVVPARRYLDRILDFIDEQERVGGWHCLSFYSSNPAIHGHAVDLESFWGLIGLLFRTREVPPLIAEVRHRCDEDPVDLLVRRHLFEHQLELRAHVPSLFEHVGIQSSLETRIQRYHAWRFAGDRRPLHRAVRLLRHRIRVRWHRWMFAHENG